MHQYIRQALHQNPMRDDIPFPGPPGSGGGDRIYLCELLQDWNNRQVQANVYYYRAGLFDRVDVAEDVTVFDPLSIMEDQVAGDHAWCHQQAFTGAYFAWQGPCAGTGDGGLTTGTYLPINETPVVPF